MAKLTVPDLTSEYSWPKAGRRQRIGYQRFIERTGSILYCYHYNTNVVTFDRLAASVTVTTHGWHVPSTRAAISDFLSALSLPHRLSFAQNRPKLGPYQFYLRITVSPSGELLESDLS